MRPFPLLLLSICLGFCSVNHSHLYGQGTTELIAGPGTQIPGHGIIDHLLVYPGINENGKVLFGYNLTENGGSQNAEWDQGQFTVVRDDNQPGPGFGTIIGFSDDHVVLWRLPPGFQFETHVLDRATGSWTEYFVPNSPDPEGNGTIRRSWYPHVSPDVTQMTLHVEFLNTANYPDDNGAVSVVNLIDAPQRIARENNPAPGGGTYKRFSPDWLGGGDLPDEFAVNNHGHVVFPASLTPDSLQMAIFLWDGTGVNPIIRHGQLSPAGDQFVLPAAGAGAVFSFLSSINESSHVGIQSRMLEAGTNDPFDAVFLYDGQALNEKLRLPANVGGVDMSSVDSSVRLNNVGDMAFATTTALGPAVVLIRDNTAIPLIYASEPLGNGDSIGDSMPRRQDTFENENEPWIEINEHGTVCMLTTILPQDSPFVDRGIVLSDGVDRMVVARDGDPLGPGQTLQLTTFAPLALQGFRFFNDFGQVVYLGDVNETSDQNIRLFTPDLSWRGGSSGSWDDNNNWTLSLPPAHVHPVSITSGTGDLIVQGSASKTAVKNLLVEGLGGNTAELVLQSTLEATDGVIISGGATLSGSGTIDGNLTIDNQLTPGTSIGEINITGDLTLNHAASTTIEITGAHLSEFDRLTVAGDAVLDGTLNLQMPLPSILANGQQFIIVGVAGTSSGQFINWPEGALVQTSGTLEAFWSYAAGDGDDIGIVVAEPQQPFGRKLLDGMEVGGTIVDTDDSDDVYYELDPSPTNNPAKQIVEMILLGESPITNPSSFSFRLEAAMSGGPQGDVVQTIELWDETGQQWEVLDTRPATNADSTVYVTPVGDLTRFIHPLTDEIIAKAKWVSPEFNDASFDWSIDIDQLGWLIGS